MSKKILFPVGVIALITASGVAYAAYAYQGDPGQRDPQFFAERHEAMQKAFESNDYNAWKELMNGRGRITQVINEGNFAQFAEMHRLMLSGKYDEANKIRGELGLRKQNRGQDKKNRNYDCLGGGKYRNPGNGPRGDSQS